METAPGSFVDAMDETNYAIVSLSKPMGIVFEENDVKTGGVFILSITEGSAADKEGILQPGYQLVAVNDKKVSGLSFEDALGTIKDSTSEKTQLMLFRGEAKQLYGPTGASQAWLDDFIANKSL